MIAYKKKNIIKYENITHHLDGKKENIYLKINMNVRRKYQKLPKIDEKYFHAQTEIENKTLC